jgi:hypothetical protein
MPDGKFSDNVAEYFQPGAKVSNGVTGVGVGVGVGVPPPPLDDFEQALPYRITKMGKNSK